MRYNTAALTLLMAAMFLVTSAQTDKMVRKYNAVTFFNETESTEWTANKEGHNTFIINCNANGDILYLKANKEMEMLVRIGSATKGRDKEGHGYQLVKMRDQNKRVLYFQLYDDEEDGVKMIYHDLKFMMQFINDDSFEPNE